jgi:predicted Ser/Thr protein kinase
MIGLGLILLFVFFLKKRSKQSKKVSTQTNSSQSEQTQENSVTLTEQDPNYIAINDLSRRKGSQSESLTRSDFLFAQSTVKHSQVSFNELTIEKEIGEGSYGKVCLGKWNKAPVALKFCKKKGKMEEFMAEVKLMILLPPHPNVVHMFGVSVDGPQPVIILEFCVGGSLDKLLFDSNEKISDEHKMRLVRGIAAGMYHLHKHNIVHRDLAARNILLTASGDPKISLRILFIFSFALLITQIQYEKHDFISLIWFN